jgi:hypothetical protein
MIADVCARCGKLARGVAEIDGKRYCHVGESPTCYEQASAPKIQIGWACTPLTPQGCEPIMSTAKMSKP